MEQKKPPLGGFRVCGCEWRYAEAAPLVAAFVWNWRLGVFFLVPQLLAEDGDLARRADADLHAVALDAEHAHENVPEMTIPWSILRVRISIACVSFALRAADGYGPSVAAAHPGRVLMGIVGAACETVEGEGPPG